MFALDRYLFPGLFCIVLRLADASDGLEFYELLMAGFGSVGLGVVRLAALANALVIKAKQIQTQT